MPPSWARSDGLAAGIVALAALAGIALWPQLPAEVAIHVSASGTPDTYVPKAVGVLLVPAIMIATLLVLRVALYVDPPSNPRTGPVAVLATMGFLAAVHLLVLVWNAGYPVPLDGLLVGSIVFGALLCGYAIWRERLSAG